MTDPELVEAIAEALWAVRTGYPIGQSTWPNVSDDALTVTRRDAAAALAVVQVRGRHMASALTLIDRYGCTNYTGPSRCIDSPERRRDAEFGAEQWCDACIAHDAVTARAYTTVCSGCRADAIAVEETAS